MEPTNDDRRHSDESTHLRSGTDPVDPGDADAVLELFRSIADRAEDLLGENDDWSMSGERPTQYAIDVEIDEMCIGSLHDAGLAVLSEESGITSPDGSTLETAPSAVVVVDPLDGSTNASLGLPWCATSLCLVVDGDPSVALVGNLRTGQRYEATRGGGATLDGEPIRVRPDAPDLADALVAVNANPPADFPRRQLRAMGATALDMASVASSGTTGGFDAYVDFDDDAIGVWDYLAALLVLHEAGGATADALGRELVVLDHDARRRPMGAASEDLLRQVSEVAGRVR